MVADTCVRVDAGLHPIRTRLPCRFRRMRRFPWLSPGAKSLRQCSWQATTAMAVAFSGRAECRDGCVRRWSATLSRNGSSTRRAIFLADFSAHRWGQSQRPKSLDQRTALSRSARWLIDKFPIMLALLDPKYRQKHVADGVLARTQRIHFADDPFDHLSTRTRKTVMCSSG